jgi:hypothetical protein
MWNCQKCNEEIEDTFDVCWNCGTSKEGIIPEDIDEFKKIKKEIAKELAPTNFKFKTSTFRAVFCFIATVAGLSKLPTLNDASDHYAIAGAICAFILFLYWLWGSTLKLFPGSVNNFVIENDQLILRNAYGKEKDIIKINTVSLYGNGDIISINGINRKGKNKIFEIEKHKLEVNDYERIKSLLKKGVVSKSGGK